MRGKGGWRSSGKRKALVYDIERVSRTFKRGCVTLDGAVEVGG